MVADLFFVVPISRIGWQQQLQPFEG